MKFVHELRELETLTIYWGSNLLPHFLYLFSFLCSWPTGHKKREERKVRLDPNKFVNDSKASPTGPNNLMIISPWGGSRPPVTMSPLGHTLGHPLTGLLSVVLKGVADGWTQKSGDM